MDFKLTRPCDQCPFTRTCLKGWLGETRAAQIAESITTRQESFPCHKTTEANDGEHVPTPGEQHCAGTLILTERIGRPGQLQRIAGRMGLYDPAKLTGRDNVFATTADFVAHHTEE